MNKESLIKAREIIIEALDNSDINLIDKIELMMNLAVLLDVNNYEDDIKILRKERRSKDVR